MQGVEIIGGSNVKWNWFYPDVFRFSGVRNFRWNGVLNQNDPLEDNIIKGQFWNNLGMWLVLFFYVVINFPVTIKT